MFLYSSTWVKSTFHLALVTTKTENVNSQCIGEILD